MERVAIESLRPEEISEAARVLASAMSSNPIHVAVLGGQDGTERDLQEAFSTGAFGRWRLVVRLKRGLPIPPIGEHRVEELTRLEVRQLGSA